MLFNLPGSAFSPHFGPLEFHKYLIWHCQLSVFDEQILIQLVSSIDRVEFLAIVESGKVLSPYENQVTKVEVERAHFLSSS